MNNATRSYVEYAISYLIDLLDQIDGDPDPEPESDAEPEPLEIWLRTDTRDCVAPRSIGRMSR